MILDNTYTEVAKDLQIMEELFCETEEDYEELYRQVDLTADEFTEIKAGRLIPDKIQLDNIYNCAYNHNLYLNEISWLEAQDEYSSGNITVQSHGAHIPITGDIVLKKAPGSSNDFGDGFYLGEDISQAGTWVANDINSSLYIFTFDRSDLVETKFNVDVDWMLAVALCRNKLDDYMDNPRLQKIKEDIDNCDYVYAPIADNNLFEIIDAFINGEITDLQCLYAISATHLGYQVVLKNDKALSHIDLKKHLYLCSVEKSLFNKERDIEVNTSMNKAKIAQSKYKDVGKYINEILVENSIKEDLQGLESIPTEEIKEDILSYIYEVKEDNNLNIDIHNLYFNGSRARGTARDDSDLDVIVSYSGDLSEDSLFNILHEEPLVMYGLEVDINPINIEETNINNYMKKSLDYDKKVLDDINREKN